MHATRRIKTLTVIFMITLIIALPTFGQMNQQEPPKPQNLKVLPKNISHDELIQTMRGYSKSLGVRCGECHATMANSDPQKPELDFASDAKPEKTTARQMIKMENSINEKYLSKMAGGKLEQITCVTCHHGSLKPMVSADSLPKQEKH
ncbi:MAG: c-type cytochrome [Chitinophagales bacterium]